jgi:beta-glucan synthesis-associated protein KRE6
MNSNNPFSPPAPPPHGSGNHLSPPQGNVYQQTGSSQEHLIPPQGFSRGDGSPARSPFDDSYTTSSRRSSWQSERTGDSRAFGNPFRDGDEDSSRPVSRDGSEDDLNTQTVSEKYNITPSAGLLLFPEDVEKDDYLHNPDPGGEPRDCDIFTRRGLVNVGGLAFITLGLLCLFIGYPVLYVKCSRFLTPH